MAVHTPEHRHVQFEPSDISPKGTILAGLGVFVGLWLFAGLLYFLYTGLAQHRQSVSPPTLPIELHGYVVPPAPRLQASPRLEMKKMNQYEDWELSHYHWLDQAHGVVAIPIDKAVEITEAKGIPPATGAPNPTNTPPQEGTRETGFQGKVEPELR